MSPEAAALLGVAIGAILSFVVNERSQSAERQRLEMQFAETAKKEQRDAAHQARRQRLQPALRLLSALEQMVGRHLESSALDALRPGIEERIGPAADWDKIKAELTRTEGPLASELVGSYFPAVLSIPVPSLVTELRYLVAIGATNPFARMNAGQRDEFLTRVRDARNMADGEIIRGDWP